MFRRDPKSRTAYLALRALLKNPLSPVLWAEIEATTPAGFFDEGLPDFGSWEVDNYIDFLLADGASGMTSTDPFVPLAQRPQCAHRSRCEAAQLGR